MLGLNGLVNNHHLTSSSNSIDSLVGNGSNVALSTLGNHSLRGGMGGVAVAAGGGNGLSGLMGNMNTHNARLNLAAAVAQQQNHQLQHESSSLGGHQALGGHHDLGGNSMLGGLGMANSFGGLFN